MYKIILQSGHYPCSYIDKCINLTTPEMKTTPLIRTLIFIFISSIVEDTCSMWSTDSEAVIHLYDMVPSRGRGFSVSNLL